MSRTELIPLRVSPEEKALIESRAKAAGLKTSAWLRQAGMADPRPAVRKEAPRPEPAGDFEARVRELARTMPLPNAERLARRERAREAHLR